MSAVQTRSQTRLLQRFHSRYFLRPYKSIHFISGQILKQQRKQKHKRSKKLLNTKTVNHVNQSNGHSFNSSFPVSNPKQKVEVVFSFDTTYSMYTVAAQVRLKIKECVERLFKEIGNDHLRIGIIMHGDYLEDCRPFWSPLYVTKHLPLTTNVQAIVDFVDSAAEIANFTGPECYELVLHEAQAFQWTAGLSHVLVLIGDEVPHEPDENPQHLNWRDELEKLRQMNVVVYGVQARNQEHAKQFYAQCAEKTGGIHLPLAQFNSMVEIIMAVCYHETAQTGRVAQFEREIQAQPGRYNRVIRSVFDRILGRPDSLTNLPGDLHACPVDRFQVLDVGLDTPIRQFVQDQGIQFVSGRGFYEFTKKETIQLYKEIVIMDKQSGDLFEGQYARTLLNLPADQTVKVEPEQLDYIVFVQSTSYNRQLLAGTRFLYESR